MALTPEEQSERLAKFDEICVDHPRLKRIKSEVASLAADTRARIQRNQSRLELAGHRPVKLDELWILPIVGPSGAGKSFAIEKIVDSEYERLPQGSDSIPILPVTLRSSTKSARQFQRQILEAYDDPSASVILRERDYSEANVNNAIRKIARHRQTSIIVLDEAHNLLANSQSNGVMGKAIRSLVNDGLFSVVLAGTDEVLPLLRNDKELRSRYREGIWLSKLELTQDDCTYFLSFASYFESELIAQGIVDQPIGLTETIDDRATLYDMADGVIGIVVRVLRLALQRGFQKEGGVVVDWLDIAKAYRSLLFSNADSKSVTSDPFRSGPKAETKRAMEEQEKEAEAAK